MGLVFFMAGTGFAAWMVLDDFSGRVPPERYLAYDSDPAPGRAVVYTLTEGGLQPVKTIIRSGYTGGFWWIGGERLHPGDSVKTDLRLGAPNIAAGFRFSRAPFGKPLTSTALDSSGDGMVSHGVGSVYADTCWIHVYQRAGHTPFQVNAGTGGTGQGGAIAAGKALDAGRQPSVDDFFTLVVTRGEGIYQNRLTWHFEGDYFSENTGVVTLAGVSPEEGLYFGLNLNGSSIQTRFSKLSFQPKADDPPETLDFQDPAWTHDGSHRLILYIPAALMMDARDADERPALTEVDFMELLASVDSPGKKPDLSTLHLVEFDPETGEPVPYPNNARQTTPADRPVRWYDGVIPFHFPDFSRDISTTDGTFIYEHKNRWGHFFETVGDWKQGRIGWVHTQRRDRPSFYAAYFNLMEEERLPPATPPRDMIGDGIYRTEAQGATTTGQLHTRIALDDWNGNGLMDIVAGNHRGQITWWPNLGTAEEPRFAYSRMVFMEDGEPLDVGRHGSPTIADWDGDGVKDLIVSSLYHGRLNFFKNVGSNADRVFSYRGFLKADDQIIESPSDPVPETLAPDGRQSIHREYYSQPIAVDWNGNGHLDLLTGGYVTGRIYFYRNTGETDVDGLPVLTFEGPIEADGAPLDVGWAASPVVADFNHNGKLDLLAGLWMKPGHGGTIPQPGEPFLRFFENIGTRTEPELTLRPVPRRGDWPAAALATPGAWDFNHNGRLDLVVSAGLNIYLIENIGTPEMPRFDAAGAQQIQVANGSAPLPLRGRFQDINGNGFADIVDGTFCQLNTGEGYPFRFGPRISLLPPGIKIDHPVEQGDGWHFHLMTDFDGDGETDVLFGDFLGQVWFHRNLGGEEFDSQGVRLADTTGAPIRVGPAADGEWDFTILQGARIMFACADFTGNGRKDLVTRDTLGNITFFERHDSGETIMRPGVVIAEGQGRGFVYDVDWNGNDRKEVYLPGSGARDLILLNTVVEDGSLVWTEQVFERPGIPVEGTDTSAQPVDLNGDGDIDILVTNGHRFTSLFERSFLELGYAQGRVIALESAAPR